MLVVMGIVIIAIDFVGIGFAGGGGRLALTTRHGPKMLPLSTLIGI